MSRLLFYVIKIEIHSNVPFSDENIVSLLLPALILVKCNLKKMKIKTINT